MSVGLPGGTPGLGRVPTLRDRKCHVYAVYTWRDDQKVQTILAFLTRCGYRVFDPSERAIPGKSKFEVTETGINLSRIFLIFLSKHFKKHGNTRYEAEQVANATGLRPGRHRMITVMLDTCMVPRFLRAEMCVYAWKYKEDQTKVHQRILQALQAPHPRVRTKHLGSKIWSSQATRRADPSAVSRLSAIVYFKRLLVVLQSCELHCTNEGCKFWRHGGEFLLFHKHIQTCSFRAVPCQYSGCRQTIQQKRLAHHLQHCPYRNLQVPCRIKGCGKIMRQAQIKDHEKVCPHAIGSCPNEKRGCKIKVSNQDLQNHLEICEFALRPCKDCKVPFTKEDLAAHFCDEAFIQCEICRLSLKRKDMDPHFKDCSTLVPCENEACHVQVRKGELQQHRADCGHARYSCQNAGCTFRSTKLLMEAHSHACGYQTICCVDCGLKIAVRDVNIHKSCCDRLLSCEKCGAQISSSSKLTHDKWLCTKQRFMSFCQVCEELVTMATFDDHQAQHQADNRTVAVRSLIGEQTLVRGTSQSNTRSRSVSETSYMTEWRPGLSNTTPSSSTVTADYSAESLLLNALSGRQPSAAEPQSTGGRNRSLSEDDWCFPGIRISKRQRDMLRKMDHDIDKHRTVLQNYL